MDWKNAVERLKESRTDLEALGVRHVSVFGSTARGEAGEGSDVDVAVVFDNERIPHGFAYAEHLDTVERRVSEILGTQADVIAEPARKPALQETIERERRRVF